MLANWLKQVFADTSKTTDNGNTALAAIGLVVEVVQADQRCADEELDQLRRIAVEEFAIDAMQVDQLIANALDDHNNRVSVQPLTRLINETFSVGQKADLMKAMWTIAYADGSLEKYEEGTIRKIADLLYIPHSVFIKTKLLAAEGKLQKGSA
jgi:uncharacterized tellurite resistance protein B-like protein